MKSQLNRRGNIRVVCFDFGFTLWDEQRNWTEWAEWLGIPTLDFFAVLGDMIERGDDHRKVFQFFRPGIDLDHERRLREAAGKPDDFRAEDLYPDVLPCLRQLRGAGYGLGVAGNQLTELTATLHAMNLPLDFVRSSEEWGVSKPSPEFFVRLVEVACVPASEIAYVGDRVDNDVLPAKRAGMLSVFLPRGPWGLIHARREEAAQADARIDSLEDLIEVLGRRC